MEEAVVEALMFTALIAIATVLGAYFTVTTSSIAQDIRDANARIVREEIIAGIIDACRAIAGPPAIPEQYKTVNITVESTRRIVLHTTHDSILINPAGTRGTANVSLDDLEWACSLGAGRSVSLTIESGRTARGTSVTVGISVDTSTWTGRVWVESS